ncbi:PAS domain-containing protein [Frankia sp. Cppng1_Ct_nod]|uniref:PAS domain-containing protein n=1 Tax=Frankia sp. Cppng1_Ct_nod TaxID=2897162 RepID=UPI001F5E6638|nr:PAS domain-containing protein [Frankia sp. Cppng1_Ct_nod]
MRVHGACHDRDDRLEILLATLPSSVLMADGDARVVAVNQNFCDLFELADAPADLIGVDCRTVARPVCTLVEDPSGFAARLDLLLRRRRKVRDEEVMFSDGRVFARSHIPVFNGDVYGGHLWLYVDITDRRILEAETEWLISET